MYHSTPSTIGGGIVVTNDSDVGGIGFHNEKRHRGTIILVLRVIKIWAETPVTRGRFVVRRRTERISNKDTGCACVAGRKPWFN